MYKLFFKRIMDILVSLILLIFLFPIFLVLMILLFCDLRGNPFFSQMRPGKNTKLFALLKFRTMNNKKDAAGNLFPDSERLTLFGRVLRRFSLDEIPQLFNVILGDMSLIGPRPLLPEYLPLYTTRQARRHEVLPGITGWAQVNGRNQISWQSKFEYDCWYVDHICFKMDLKIIYLTVKKVISGDGVKASKVVIMEKFTGTTNT